MREPLWQPLVAPALVRSLSLLPECLYDEVPTRDGSIADLVYAAQGRLVGFELKMSDEGEALHALSGRDTRQLRHYSQACNAVYLITVGAPRAYSLGWDGRVVLCDPLERQALPEGVGWIAFDRLSLEATVLVPAPELKPDLEHRQFMVNHLLNRLHRASKQLRHLGAGAA